MGDQQHNQKQAQLTNSDAVRSENNRLLFPLGEVVATPNALKQLRSIGKPPLVLVGRHVLGDWGNVCPDDAESNREAIKTGRRILSSYDLDCGTVWVITEADRSVTTILLPSDY